MSEIKSFIKTDEKNRLVMTHIQNVSAIYADNYEMRKRSDDAWNSNRNTKLYAQIPVLKWLEWERLGITKDEQALKKAIELFNDVKVTTKTI